MGKISGGCLCGAIRFEVEAEPLWLSHCYCRMCRKTTGAALGTYVGFPAGSVHWLAGERRRYQSSSDVKRGFCGDCGSTLTFERYHETSIALGSLDEADATEWLPVRRVHVMCRERIPWLEIADDWLRFDGFGPGREDELEAAARKAGVRDD